MYMMQLYSFTEEEIETLNMQANFPESLNF